MLHRPASLPLPARAIPPTLVAAAAVVAALVVGTQDARADTATYEAESMSLPPSQGQAFSDGSASGGQGLLIWSNGTASKSISTSGAQSLTVRARGDQCSGAPRMVVAVDGQTVLETAVSSKSWANYSANLVVPDGSHSLTISFTNDYSSKRCDRNLRLDNFTITSSPPPPTGSSGFEAESMSLPSSQGQVFSDGSASGGQGLLIWSNGTASKSVTTGGTQTITVRARGDQCDGAPQMVVAVDGQNALSTAVSSTSWADYSAAFSIPSGSHTIAISFTNDYLSGCDRNLRLDKVSFGSSAPPPPPPTSSNPFSGAKLFIDPNSNARQQADAWRSSRPADAAQMDKIAGQPQADWFGDWSGDIQSAVSSRVSTIRAAGALPVLVAYDIPQRDCGSYSSGGANSPDAYRSWIRSFAAGLGSGNSVVILEPDALAAMDCLSASDQSTRQALLADAVSVLSSHPGTYVYLDGGHSHWHSATEMASRLRNAGVAEAQGFSLNVSNFNTTGDERSYGDAVSALVAGKHFVIDTSRNGLGSNGEWCNPSGRALGDRPTASTGDPLADAYFWIKRPGESDGTCNGGPPAGQWWADYALGLAQRAAY
jgi:endoglucanase